MRNTLLSLVTLAVFLTACADSPLGPDADATLPGVRAAIASASATQTPVCEVIDFGTFAHGQEVAELHLATFGFNLIIEAVAYADAGHAQAPGRAMAFNGDGTGADWHPEDYTDLQSHNDAAASQCADCGVQGMMLIIEDPRGFADYGDARRGGQLTFVGVPMDGTYFIRSFVTADNDASEMPVFLRTGGVIIGQSANAGNGEVETVLATETMITTGNFNVRFGNGQNYAEHRTGSGAIDDIELCRYDAFVPGDDGCTLGYWKNHQADWQTYAPTDALEDVFDIPDYLGLDDVTLAAALSFGGGPGTLGGAKILLKQAVASVLNAAHADVMFAWSLESVISAVNTALAGSRSDMTSLAEELDALNKAGCPL